MELVDGEMILLNSLIGGGAFFGITLKQFKDNEYDEVLQSLVKKRILKSNNELAPASLLVLETLKEYKNASQYIIINYCRIALISKERAVVIIPKKGGYEVFAVHPMVLLYKIIDSRSILKQEVVDVNEKSISTNMDTVLMEIAKSEDNLVLGNFIGSRTVSEQVIYWSGENIWRYSFTEQKKESIGSKEARNILLKLLTYKEQEVKV